MRLSHHYLLAFSAVFLALGASESRAQSVPTDPTAGAADASTSTSTPPRRSRRFPPPLGPQVEATYLLDSKTRDRFGSTVLSIGPGFGDPSPRSKGEIEPDLSLTSAHRRQNGSNNRLFLVSIGPEYKKAFATSAATSAAASSTDPAPRFSPYYGASVSALYAKVKVPSQQIDDSGFGAGGSVFLGFSFQRRAVLEARLRATTSVQGFNFSSLGLTFGLRF